LCRYDSLTGVPSCQRTVAFEKASVLFNIGGLYTQIGKILYHEAVLCNDKKEKKIFLIYKFVTTT
jgi:hypothetical protein